MVQAPMILSRGDVVGPYRIGDVIGIGGMAVVYRAEQVAMGRQVALKVLQRRFAGDDVLRERFRREGRHVAALDHPHVITVYDQGESDGLFYLAMRLVEGSTLGERLNATGLAIEETLAVLTPIAAALDSAHHIGLVHRDVKPQNILLTSAGHPYLSDFGIAKLDVATFAPTSPGGFVGSIHYASPEQIAGDPVTPASDTYSLTATLYQCMTGMPPYTGRDPAIVRAHLYEPPPSLPAACPNAHNLDSVIARGMAKLPSDRYETAGALLADAAAAVSLLPPSLGAAARRTPTPPTIRAGDAEATRTPSPTEPTAEAATASTRDRRLRLRSRAAVGVVLPIVVVSSGAAAILMPMASSGHSLKTATTATLRLDYRAPWQLARGAFAHRRSLRRPIELSAQGATVAAGVVVNSALIPGGAPPDLVPPTHTAGVPVIVGGKSGRQYAWTSGHSRFFVDVLAGDPSDVALVCSFPTSGSAPNDPCRSLDFTLTMVTGRFVAPGLSPRYVTRLRRLLAELIGGRSRVNASSHEQTVFRAAAELSRLESRELADIEALTPLQRARPAFSRFDRALGVEARALGRLAAGGQPTYTLLRPDVVAAGAATDRAWRHLTSYGITVANLPPIHLGGSSSPGISPPPERNTPGNGAAAGSSALHTTSGAGGSTSIGPPATSANTTNNRGGDPTVTSAPLK